MADETTETEVSEDTETTEEETTSTEETEDWKAHSRKHEREAKKARREADELRKQLAEREDASKSEQEKALEKARQEAADAAKAETASTYRKKILEAEIRAQAAGKFANPKLAVRLLDLDEAEVFDDEGDLDEAAIGAAIDEFLAIEDNKGLKANGHRPSGSSDAGKGTGGDLDETDPRKLAAMVPRY